jgi:uncharacterized protein with PQ loop repeat
MPELIDHVKAKLVAEIANSRFSQKGSIALTLYLFYGINTSLEITNKGS